MSIVRSPRGNFYAVQHDLQREMNRLIDNFFPTARKSGNEETFESAVWRPMVDVHETATSYLIDAELPGVKRDDVNISFEDGVLSIAGERNYEYESRAESPEEVEAAGGVHEGTRVNCHRMERFYGKFHRTFTFPTTVDPDAINARFDAGVLRVTVPKSDAVKPRQISIN